MEIQGYLFILVGPSEAENSVLLHGVLEKLPDLKQMPVNSVRQSEHDETVKQFSEGAVNRLAQESAFTSVQEVQGKQYSTLLSIIRSIANSKEDCIAGMEVLDAIALKESFPENVILIFVRPSAMEFQENRTTHQEEISVEQVATRLDAAEFEISFLPKCDYVVINENREPAIERVGAIILAERSRRDAIQLWSIITGRQRQNNPD